MRLTTRSKIFNRIFDIGDNLGFIVETKNYNSMKLEFMEENPPRYGRLKNGKQYYYILKYPHEDIHNNVGKVTILNRKLYDNEIEILKDMNDIQEVLLYAEEIENDVI